MGTLPQIVFSCVKLCEVGLNHVRLRKVVWVAWAGPEKTLKAGKTFAKSQWRATKTLISRIFVGLQCTVFVGLQCPCLSLGLLGSRDSKPPGNLVCLKSISQKNTFSIIYTFCQFGFFKTWNEKSMTMLKIRNGVVSSSNLAFCESVRLVPFPVEWVRRK